MSGSFLGRWSRRKRGLEGEPEPAAPAPAARPESLPAPEPEPEFDPASLPPLESLDAGGDLTAFLHPRVPALLRRAALRRAWAADPGIRDFMGPADYAWDYNAPDGVPGFSFDLGDVDVKKLLAQMIGEPQDPPAPAEPVQDLPPEDEVPLEDGTPLEAPPSLLAEAAPPPPVSPLRLSTPEPELPPDAPVEPDALQPSRRRHGGALPRLG